METIKSCTDIEQSKELAKILKLESADMCYYNDGTAIKIDANSYTVRYSMWKDYVEIIPCWSLVALLNAVPQIKIRGSKKIGYIVYYNKDIASIRSFDLIDACYEMIIKLHEQKLM